MISGGISMDQVRHPLTEQVMNMDFSKFIVTMDLSNYYDVEQLQLASLQAKHIIIRNQQTEAVYKEAIAAGHTHIMWGTTRGWTPETERAIIEKMIADDFQKSIRITITDRYVWSDNNHTTISYMLRGKEKIADVPHYIVDCRGQIPVIVGSAKDILWDSDAICDAVRRAYRLQIFDENGGRVTPWTIEDLLAQLRI